LLQELFPALFALAVDRKASVANYWERTSSTNVWGHFFVWNGFVGDNTLVRFFDKLNDTTPGNSSHDPVKWDLNSKGDFTVKSYYLKLLYLNNPSLQIHFEGGFPFKLIWRYSAPLKVSFFPLWGGIAWENFDV